MREGRLERRREMLNGLCVGYSKNEGVKEKKVRITEVDRKKEKMRNREKGKSQLRFKYPSPRFSSSAEC